MPDWNSRDAVRASKAIEPTEEALQDLLKSFDKRVQRLNDQYLQMMGEHLADIGNRNRARTAGASASRTAHGMWPSDVHRLQQIRRMNRNMSALRRRIANAANAGEKEIQKAFELIAGEDTRMATKILCHSIQGNSPVGCFIGGMPDAVNVSSNAYLRNILQAQARETAGRMENLANSTVSSDAYRRAVDTAVSAVQSGVEDYGSAIRRSIREAGQMGLRVRENGTTAVEYASGHTRRLDSAVRMNILDGVRHLNQSIMDEVGRQLGADGIEIDAHMLCAEDHLSYQGRQFSNADFEQIQSGLPRPFGEWNCRHSWHPILLGIPKPAYDPEELRAMEDYSGEEIEIDGRTKTRYEWSQEMRRMETAVRQQKDTATLAKAAGDTQLERRCKGTILQLNEKYKSVADQAGLKPEFQRTFVQGYRDAEGRNGHSGLFMQSDQQTDPIKAAPIQHTEKEFDEMLRYANERGIRVHEIWTFDGDIEMFKEQVDAIAEIREEYGLHGRIAIKFADMANPHDLAKTNREGDLITFSRLALRDKDATNRYLSADNYLSTNDSKGIAYHEMGHIVVRVYGNRGIDLAAEAYYNIYGETVSRQELFDFLEDNVSQYSIDIDDEHIDKPFKRRYYKEIIPEILSQDKTNPSEFTAEFIRLLKGRCRV